MSTNNMISSLKATNSMPPHLDTVNTNFKGFERKEKKYRKLQDIYSKNHNIMIGEKEYFPEHMYGEEGCEWMDFHDSNYCFEDSEPSTPANYKTTTFSELTAENIAIHQQIISSILEKNEAERRKSIIWDIQDRRNSHIYERMAKDCQSNYENLGEKIESLVGALISVLWCIQLLLSLSATLIETNGKITWLVMYIASICGIVTSIIIIQKNSPKKEDLNSVRKDINDDRMTINTQRRYKPKYKIEIFRAFIALVAITMHSAALMICSGDHDVMWFITMKNCSDVHPARFVTLVVIESILFLFSIGRIIFVKYIKKNATSTNPIEEKKESSKNNEEAIV